MLCAGDPCALAAQHAQAVLSWVCAGAAKVGIRPPFGQLPLRNSSMDSPGSSTRAPESGSPLQELEPHEPDAACVDEHPHAVPPGHRPPRGVRVPMVDAACQTESASDFERAAEEALRSLRAARETVEELNRVSESNAGQLESALLTLSTLLRKSGSSESLPSSSLPHAGEIETGEVIAEVSGPSSSDACVAVLTLPAILPFMGVPEMMALHLASRRATDPQAMLHHVVELGNFARASSVLAFGRALGRGWRPSRYMQAGKCLLDARERCFRGQAADDPALSKRFLCHLWYMAQARNVHFAVPDSDAAETVHSLIRDLLGHCRSTDADVSVAAHVILETCGLNSSLQVRHRIADGMYSLLQSLNASGSEEWAPRQRAIEHLQYARKSLPESRRQQWFSLLRRSWVPKMELIDVVFIRGAQGAVWPNRGQ
ncbi:unnamed protein product [Symbiodinium natans]|uniref:Uncharacterized protein n=1 Tax=Symbiodinium natans TaxID=878477 RepID=A0A812GQH8_9DINO|nr:unnamed protein product [Symbiodinium natans]